MNASRQGHVDMVRILLDSGANPLLKNKYEETAYDLAAQEERAYICHLLISSESKWIASQYVRNLGILFFISMFNYEYKCGYRSSISF